MSSLTNELLFLKFLQIQAKRLALSLSSIITQLSLLLLKRVLHDIIFFMKHSFQLEKFYFCF